MKAIKQFLEMFEMVTCDIAISRDFHHTSISPQSLKEAEAWDSSSSC